MSFQISSSAFDEGQPIPTRYTADNRNVSPPLLWTDPPAGTLSLALVCEDPDAPRGTWTHWVLFNLPPTTRSLAKGLPPTSPTQDGAEQGVNDFGKVGYGGPSPPPGKPHRYFFKLFALDQMLDLPPGASRAQLLSAMKGHVLGEAEIMGTYQREKA